MSSFGARGRHSGAVAAHGRAVRVGLVPARARARAAGGAAAEPHGSGLGRACAAGLRRRAQRRDRRGRASRGPAARGGRRRARGSRPARTEAADRAALKDAARLEADLARLSSATTQARAAIEDASLRAAKASHAAIEAAGLVRDGAERMTLKAEDSIAGAHGRDRPPALRCRTTQPRPSLWSLQAVSPPMTEAASVLTSLAGDLEALERFARDRKTIASESAAALTVALVEAIDRLNGVADRISATADLGAKERSGLGGLLRRRGAGRGSGLPARPRRRARRRGGRSRRD